MDSDAYVEKWRVSIQRVMVRYGCSFIEAKEKIEDWGMMVEQALSTLPTRERGHLSMLRGGLDIAPLKGH